MFERIGIFCTIVAIFCMLIAIVSVIKEYYNHKQWENRCKKSKLEDAEKIKECVNVMLLHLHDENFPEHLRLYNDLHEIEIHTDEIIRRIKRRSWNG